MVGCLCSFAVLMSNIEHRYDFIRIPKLQASYLFFSEGRDEDSLIAKIIQYDYLRDYDAKPVYNLGFGDLNANAQDIDDQSITDIGDVYKVFNTVLSTIPYFFKKYPGVSFLVRGSDGGVDFEANCRQVCTRNCTGSCYKFNRRMKLYCSHTSRKLPIYSVDYHLLGGISDNKDWFDFEAFRPGKLYDCIMVHKKCVNL